MLLSACGGGGSSSGSTPPAGISEGGLTLLVGDGPVADENVQEVNIVIEEIVLLGADGQTTIADETIGPINLLDLRNVTELLFDGDVPAGDYSKIRLFISSLEIVEADGDPVEAQLPANGKIDLNPQGAFNIAEGEDLVIQIDIDLERSIHIVDTGSSRYRFRPVVFIDVIDQTDNLRLVKLFGEVVADVDGSPESDFDLCPLEEGDDPCQDVINGDSVRYLDVDGATLEDPTALLDQTAHVFGRYFLGAEGERFFRAVMVVLGDEDSLTQQSGDVNSAVVDDAFDLVDDVETFSVLIGDALLLNEFGGALEVAIDVGQEAEAWAQNVVLEAAEAGDFPAFLVQIKADDDEDSVEGLLAGIEGDVITLQGDNGDLCVLFTSETEIQQLVEDGEGTESMMIDFATLTDLVGQTVEIEAFGEMDGECLVADLIVVEVGSAD